MFEDDMVKVESICQGTANKVFQKFKERQRSKFESLHKKSKTGFATTVETDGNIKQAWIVNLSDRKFSEAEESILSKGPRYATTPKIRAIDIAAPMEATL